MADDELAREQKARHVELQSKRRAEQDPTWQSLANYCKPQLSNINTEKLPGTVSGWFDRVFDTTAIHAARVLRTGQRNWLTPSSEEWMAYEPPSFLSSEGREEEKDEASTWLSNATEVTMRELASSNFYAKVNADYGILAVFATGCLFAEEGKKTTLNFRNFVPWDLTIEEDEEGYVDTVRREFDLTSRQAMQKFGAEKLKGCTKIIEDHANPGKMPRKFKFLHCIMPREDSQKIAGRMTGDAKAIASIYIAMDDCCCIDVSGYDEMPAMVSRFDDWGADTPWGVGPAFECLPDIRQLNDVSQYRDALAELRAFPRFKIPDSMEGDMDLRAGGPTIVNGDDMSRGVEPKEWMTVGDDKAAEDNMERKKESINRMFYVDMFTLLAELQDKKMTAYEIAQRLGEKLEQFTPVFDRRVTEFLNPLLRRVFGILYRAGKFGQAPQSLLVPQDGGKSYGLALPEIAITSRISLALKVLKNQGMVNTIQTILPLTETKPEIWDSFDVDKMARELARNNGVPSDIMRPLREVAKIRAARAQQIQAQQAAELAERLGGTVKDLGAAPKPIQDAVIEQFAG